MTKPTKEQLENIKALDKLEKKYEKDLITNYQGTLKEIRLIIALIYEKYDGDWIELQRYNRLNKFEKDIAKVLKELIKDNGKVLKNCMIGTCSESYHRTSWEISNEVAGAIAFYFMDQKTVEELIKNPYDRVGYNERNRMNVSRTDGRIKDSLSRSFVHKESYRTTASKIKKLMDMSANQALTIARTEMGRVRQKGNYESMLEAERQGLNIQKMWLAVVDNRTRDIHGAVDGQILKLDEPYIVGGEQLQHPKDPAGSAGNVINCRCESLSIVDGFKPGFRYVKGLGTVKYGTFEEFMRDGLIPNK